MLPDDFLPPPDSPPPPPPSSSSSQGLYHTSACTAVAWRPSHCLQATVSRATVSRAAACELL